MCTLIHKGQQGRGLSDGWIKRKCFVNTQKFMLMPYKAVEINVSTFGAKVSQACEASPYIGSVVTGVWEHGKDCKGCPSL